MMNSKDGKIYITSFIAIFFIIGTFLIIFSKLPLNKSFSDNVLQTFLIITTILNVGFCVLAIIYNSPNKRKKLRFEYHVKDNAPFMTTKGAEVPNIDAIIKDDKRNLYLVTVKIQNSGNTSITPKDFSKEMSLSFGDDAEILKVDILEKRPSGRIIEFMTDEHELFIEPMLLNRKDTVTLAVLLKGVVDKVALIGNGQGIISEVFKR